MCNRKVLLELNKQQAVDLSRLIEGLHSNFAMLNKEKRFFSFRRMLVAEGKSFIMKQQTLRLALSFKCSVINFIRIEFRSMISVKLFWFPMGETILKLG